MFSHTFISHLYSDLKYNLVLPSPLNLLNITLEIVGITGLCLCVFMNRSTVTFSKAVSLSVNGKALCLNRENDGFYT